MQKIVSIKCPKCNNNHHFYRYGKDKDGYQKYLCRNCNYQFAPDRPNVRPARNYTSCPLCDKATFLHHDYDHYSNYRCDDKKCNHSMFIPKANTIPETSMSKLFGKTDFKRMRYPVHIIISALSMFYLGKSSFRNIALILRITNSETRFVLGFHLSPHRDGTQAFALMNAVKDLGTAKAVVSDRYSAYKVPIKSVLGDDVKHIRVQSFKDDISNNLIESFHHQFKAWYKTKQGFNSFDSANNLISMFIFFSSFVRPHSSLNGLTPAQIAGLSLTTRQKRKFI